MDGVIASEMLPVVTIERTPARQPTQADNDAQLIRLWLHGRAATTTVTYSTGACAFLAFVGKPLHQVTLGDLHDFADSLAHLRPALIACKLAGIKSLFSFAHDLGYLPLNVGRVLRLPPIRDCRAERILDEAAVHRMIDREPNPRNAALLHLLYAAGLRISEVCELRGRDMAARDDAGQVTVFGKGGKTRAVLLPASTWRLLAVLRVGGDPDQAVFRSRQGGGPLDRLSIHRIVKLAALRAGLSGSVYAHWLRHAHASHALNRGAPVHLVQAALGHASLATTSRYTHAWPGDSSSKYLGL